MKKHSSMPWHVRKGPEGELYIDCKDGYTIGECHYPKHDRGVERRANAKLMVLACNSHFDLVDACEALANEAKRLGDYLSKSGKGATALGLCEIRARKAIAKARGRA